VFQVWPNIHRPVCGGMPSPGVAWSTLRAGFDSRGAPGSGRVVRPPGASADAQWASRLLRGSIVRILIVATRAFVVLALQAAPSHALKTYNLTGKPGRSLHYQVQGTQDPLYHTTQLAVPGPIAYRSKAYSGTQYIAIKRAAYIVQPSTPLEGFNRWRLDSESPSAACRLSPGKRCNGSKNLWMVPNAHPFVSYHIRYRITWYTESKQRIGRYFVDYNRADDYHCNTPYPKCATGYSSPSNFAYIAFGI
jgi:hypothetical protein